MKKIIVVSTLAMAGVFSAQTLADGGKTDFYVAGETGASVVARIDQCFRQSSEDDIYKYKGGDESGTVFGANLVVDYNFYQHYNVPVRTEVEFYGCGAADSHYTLDTWHSPMGDDGREDAQNGLSMDTLVVNTYYDSRNSSAFTSWMSIGLGYARVHHKATYIDTSWNKSDEVSDISTLHYSRYDNNFAWNIGAGIRYGITPDVALDLSYRYLDASRSSLSYKSVEGDKYKSEADVKSHDIMSGVTYNF